MGRLTDKHILFTYLHPAPTRPRPDGLWPPAAGIA